jgi:hypothetical protein
MRSQPHTFLDETDSSYLDRELLIGPRLKPMKASELDAYNRNDVRHFCFRTGRYGLPTIELIEWLKEKIGGRSAIEIGCGYGDLGSQLEIPITDLKVQKMPEAKVYYENMRQPTIDYPDDVEEIDALAAVQKYKPKVVVASWVTQWLDPEKPPPSGRGGCMWGVKEWKLIERVETYILIGNESVHQDTEKKKIMERLHESHALPFIRSRATFPEKDRVWIWNR